MPGRPSFGLVFKRALLRRCPACGRGEAFSGPLRMRSACAVCGWVLEREPGTFTGSMYLVAAATELLAVLLFAVLWLATDWPAWLMLAAGLPVLSLLYLCCFPVTKSIWAAIEY
ncbi:MAG: DUF983 domain-containing protein, partial [Planctomycetota bacterium]